jgi:nucleotide-binding universal stress UspA family protein
MEQGMALAEPVLLQPLNTILVPTDFSNGAELALERALRLPLGPHATVHVIHVLPAELPAHVRAQVTVGAKQMLEQVVSRARDFVDRDIRFSSEVLSGTAFVEIIRYSRRSGAELIVLGRHGQRPVRDMFIGTTAKRVICNGDVPVLAVNVKPTGPYCRPMIATDVTDAAYRIFELALRVLGPEIKIVTVVHAFHVPFEGFATPVPSARETSDVRKAFKEEADRRLREILAAYKHVDVRWTMSVRAGDPRSIVLDEAAQSKADLVALGTHGRSGLAHVLLGSVAESVIAAAPGDVLVTRPVRFSFELP